MASAIVTGVSIPVSSNADRTIISNRKAVIA